MSLSISALSYIIHLESFLKENIDDYGNIMSVICEYYLPGFKHPVNILFFKRFFVPMILYQYTEISFEETFKHLTSVPINENYRKCSSYSCDFIYCFEYFFIEYKPYGQYFIDYSTALKNLNCAFSFLFLKKKEVVYIYESLIIVKNIRKYIRKNRSLKISL